MHLHKAIIPAAGFGTRMLPAAKAIPKEMLPVLDRPTIQYVVEEAADAGVDDLLLITSRDKRAVEDHFDRAADLEQRLAATGRGELLKSVTELAARVRIHSVRQAEQLGLGHAVLQARQHVGNDPFHCLLGDTIFSGGTSPSRQIAEAFARFESPIIALDEVPLEHVSRYGIVAAAPVEDGIVKIESLVEKPRPEQAPSRLAIAARYVLTPDIFECLDRTRPGTGGEIQLTDGLRLLLQRRPMYGVICAAKRHDIGNPADWLATNLIFARRDPALWAKLQAILAE